MEIPETQTAMVQSANSSFTPLLPLAISHSVPVPQLPSPHHVLVRILAVALNPTDHKMVTHFPVPGNMVGCDFCGIVEKSHRSEETAAFPLGTRVCGGTFPYSQTQGYGGAFAQWIAVDCRLLLRVPESMDELHGAALGGVGWGTAGLAFYDPAALALRGRPSQPVDTKEPVLVYGGATASGTMALQLLKLSGYTPIAVTSTTSAPLAVKYGAVGTAAYTSLTCVEAIRSLAGQKPIRRAMDCITTGDSAAICFAAMARAGGRYACLEGLDPSIQKRRAIHIKEVMGYEGLGVSIDLGATSYSRDANQELFEVTTRVASEMQSLVDADLIKTHPIQQVPGKWEGIVNGLVMLQRGEVRGRKLVVRIGEK